MSYWNPWASKPAIEPDFDNRKIDVVTCLLERKNVVYDVGHFETEFVDYFDNIHVIKEECYNTPYVIKNLPRSRDFTILEGKIVRVSRIEPNIPINFNTSLIFFDEIVQKNITISPPTQEWVLEGNELIKVKNYIRKTFVKTGQKEIELDIYIHKLEIV